MIVFQSLLVLMVPLLPVVYLLFYVATEVSKPSIVNIETDVIIDTINKIKLARRSTDRIFK